MNFLIALLSVGLVVASSNPAGAAVVKTKKGSSAQRTKKATGAKKKQKPAADVQTNHNFDDHGVKGEYQMPDEALAKVENEKSLSDLLGVRKNFKDRLSEASEQE